MNQR
jgi:hypothetical protein